ncbi:MAG: hypothetical protein ABIH86_04825 [Planctomycetota bacterium]
MNFLISDTFSEFLIRLTNDEQKLVKTTAFDLHMNSAASEFQFHRIENSKDQHFWSIRVSRDIRLDESIETKSGCMSAATRRRIANANPQPFFPSRKLFAFT